MRKQFAKVSISQSPLSMDQRIRLLTGNTSQIFLSPLYGEETCRNGSLFSYKPFIDVDGPDEIVYELCNEFASCSTGTISLDVQNADPIINQEEPDRIAPKEDASILLTDYISDANGNLDLTTLEIISQPNKSTAFAEIDDQYFLKVDYSTTNFTGADRVTIGVCDLSGACIEEVIVIIVGELDKVNVFNAVSPNGDGLHDFLNIQDLEYFTSNAVFIYNRIGQLVYTMEGYENEIPGMRFEGLSDSGEDLPNGTYYWYVQMTSAEGKDYKQSGFFVLSK
jgi:gliding motility-associated-like protein